MWSARVLRNQAAGRNELASVHDWGGSGERRGSGRNRRGKVNYLDELSVACTLENGTVAPESEAPASSVEIFPGQRTASQKKAVGRASGRVRRR
jgi:hypothetical protein